MKTVYILSENNPSNDRKPYFMARHGFSTLFFTDDVSKAEQHKTKAEAQRRCDDLFEPGFYHVAAIVQS